MGGEPSFRLPEKNHRAIYRCSYGKTSWLNEKLRLAAGVLLFGGLEIGAIRQPENAWA